MASRKKAPKLGSAKSEGAEPEVVGDIRVLARVFALRFARGIKTNQEKVGYLIGAGFSQGEVAAMLHMNSTTVRTTLFNVRER